jgi:hypothetical protein
MCEITKISECALPCPSWGYVSWTTWQSKDKIRSFTRMSLPWGVTKGPVILLILPSLIQKTLSGKMTGRLPYISLGRAKMRGLYCTLKESQSPIKPHPTRFFTPSMKKWKELCPHLHYYQKSDSRTSRNYSSIFKNHFLLCMRGTNMGDQWTWETRELDPHDPYNETRYPSWILGFGFSKPQLS